MKPLIALALTFSLVKAVTLNASPPITGYIEYRGNTISSGSSVTPSLSFISATGSYSITTNGASATLASGGFTVGSSSSGNPLELDTDTATKYPCILHLSGYADTLGLYTYILDISDYYDGQIITTLADANYAAANSSILYGYIVSSCSGSPLVGALVQVGNNKVSSDATGAYLINGLVSGAYSVTVSLTNYLTTTTSVTCLSSPQAINQNFTLTPSTSISGHVRAFCDNSPIAGATLIFGTQSATSASDGSYSICSISPATYSVTVSQSGYTTFTTTLTVSSGQAVIEDYSLTSSTSISGHVRSSSDSSAIAGASVTIGTYSAISDSDGSYSITGDCAGTYNVTVTMSGYATLTTTLTISSSPQNVTQDFNLVPLATITVNAQPTTGGTVAGGGTFAVGSSQTVTAAANSSYTFANWTQNGTVVSTSASYSFTLTGNETLVANFTADTATIHGVVACSCDNSPVVNAQVIIGSQSAQTDSGGNYSISGLLPNTYPVSINGPGYNYPGLPQITISAGEIVGTSDFALKPNATDIAALNSIAPASSIQVSVVNNGTAIQALFLPKNGSVTLSTAACLLGYNHFNWYQEATGAGYSGEFCNCPRNPGAWFVDPPQYYCNGEPNCLNDGNGCEYADSLPFYYNEGNSHPGIYNIANHTYLNFLSFYDQPDVDVAGAGSVAAFVTSLVGVKDDGTYHFIRTFAWQSTFSYFGIVGGVTILPSASLLDITNGNGGVTNIETIIQPVDIPLDALALMSQNGGVFPVTIQPPVHTVVCGANVILAILPTNASSPLNYQWRINSTNIINATNITLQLTSVTTNSTGVYDAILSNTNGSIASAVATFTVVNLPIIQTPVMMTNGQILLTWTAPAGRTCQLQYKTNLLSTNWINIGSALTASNTVMAFTNAIGSDKQRFYRVQQQ